MAKKTSSDRENNCMRRIFAIGIFSISLLFFLVVVLKGDFANNEKLKDIAMPDNQIGERVEFDTIEENDISQWALFNSGGAYFSSRFSNEWEADQRMAKEGIDIHFSSQKLNIKRIVTVAIIDTGIDISQINNVNLWKNDEEIPNDGNLCKASNYGQCVDMAAPGTDIISTISGNKFGCISGTSCAAPYVTGLAAIISGYSMKPQNSQDIKEIICQNATCHKQLSGYISKGRINNYDQAISNCNPVR